MLITLLNPSVATENLGDFIIIDSVMREMKGIFPAHQVASIPTQDIIGKVCKRIAAKSEYRFIGGTNLLSSNMLRYKQWKINLFDTFSLRDVTLLGVGWWQYQNSPDLYTKIVLNRALSKNKLHSVRDEYTKQKLQSIGICNVINTGCPTMWGLTVNHCGEINQSKSENVVFTLTDYKKSPAVDIELIELLKRNYAKVYYWPQGSGDIEYFDGLSVSGVVVIPPRLDAFDCLLGMDDSIDFVGTRLHGGIRALQKKRRSLILAVDNRAREISKDTSLHVLERNDFEAISKWIRFPNSLNLNINFKGISDWRGQFSDNLDGESAS